MSLWLEGWWLAWRLTKLSAPLTAVTGEKALAEGDTDQLIFGVEGGVGATMVLSVVTAVKVPGHHQPAHQPCLHSLHPATSAVLMAASDSRSQ